MNEPIVALRNASFGYQRKALVKCSELAIGAGELVVLTGKNGSGKSTVLRSICGLLPIVQGELNLDGKPLSAMSAMERAMHVSIVLTERLALQGMDVRTLVGLGRFPHHEPWTFREQEADTLLIENAMKLMHVSAFANRPLASLSDGEMQKVMIARAICQDTSLILLDEPTAFLDYEAREELMILLRDLANSQRKAILFSSHEIGLATQYAHRRWHVENGLLVERPISQ